MKYHSTKNTIVTIMLILTSLFVVSLLGIKYLNAKTPIEAISEALVENLELPSDYQIKINNINKSFLLHQKIDSIEITKGEEVFLKLVNIELKHSILGYFRLLIFHSKENLVISVDSIEINYNKNFYDIATGLKGLKIKDNTFSRIPNEEIIDSIDIGKTFDLELFRNQIQKNHAINVSSLLPSILSNSSISVKINSGVLNYYDNNLKANTIFKNFELSISSNSLLTKIKMQITKFDLSSHSISLQADYAKIDFDKTNIDIDCENLLYNNNEVILGVDSLKINYSLLDFERAQLNYEKLHALYKDLHVKVDRGSSKIDSNFKDFSIYNNFENINVNIDNSTFDALKINLNASYVNRSLAVMLTTGPKNYIQDDKFGKFNFNNLIILLNSNTLLPNKINIKLDDGEYLRDADTIKVKDFETSISADVDSKLYFKKNGALDFTKLNLQNLKESYKEIKATISCDSSGFLNSINNDFKTKLYSTMLLEDGLTQFTGTLDLNNTYLSKVNDALNISFAYQGPLSWDNDKLKMLETHIDLGDSIKSSIVASSKEGIKEATLEGNIEFIDFMPSTVNYYVKTKSPLIANYVNDNTTVNGSFNFSGRFDEKAFLKLKGDVDSSLILNNLVFGKTPINIGLSLSSILNESNIDFTKLSIASFGYRLSGSGVYDATTNLPKLDFSVSSMKNSTKLFTISVYPNLGKLGFSILIPTYDSFKFSGMINQLDESDINLTTDLRISNDDYPITVNVDRKNYNISAFSDKGLDLNLKIGKSIKASLIFDNMFSKTLDNSYLAGVLNYSASDIGEWQFDAKDFLINYNEGKIIFGFDSKINSNEVLFSNVSFKNNLSQNVNNNSYYTGDFSYKKGESKDYYKFTPYSLKLSFGDGREQNIDVVAKNDGFSNHVFVDFSNVNFAPLLQLDSDLIFNLRLIGNNSENINSYRGNINLYDKSLTTQKEVVAVKESNRITGNFLWKTLSLIPFIDISALDTSNTTNRIINVVSPTNLSFTSDILIDGSMFSLSSLNLKAGDIKISNANINLDTNLKELEVNSSLSYLKHSKNTNQNTSADLFVSLNFKTFFDNIKNLYFNSVIDENSKLNYKKLLNKLKDLVDEKSINLETLNGIKGHIKLDNIEALKDTKDFEKLWPDTLLDYPNFSMIDSNYFIENSLINIEGINLNGKIDLINKNLKIDINKDFGIGLKAEYNYSDNNNNLMLTDIYIPTNLISRILYYNTIKIYGGAITGNLQIANINSNPKFYGLLNINKSNAKLLWLKDQEVTLHNASFVAFGNDIVVRNAKIDVYNADTNKISNGLLNLNLSYLKGTPFSISLGFHINDYVFGIFPLIGNKIWSEGYAKGDLEYIFDNHWKYINGGLIVKDATIKGELDPLPSWLESSNDFSSNIEIQTGSNVSIYYPTIDNPILKATLSKNQSFSLNIDKQEGKTSADGKVSIAQGELFYFQKNFFINSGSISFGQDIFTEKLKLLLSLNATLKEYDSEGNDIDINLILNNSSIDKLNPVFSSSPAKSTKEIMSILGQSVTGTSSDGSVQVGGLATAATSIFSTLGYINTGGVGSLNKTIANTLNLDIFSLNSNIVENLLLDTFSVANGSSNYSPLARYLDNTSIYMGKYISTNSYLQLVINLLAEKDSKQSSFLASDLKLDFEVTYDIDTPLAKFSIFTNPQQLSIIDILDTIGFSVTKTIYLR